MILISALLVLGLAVLILGAETLTRGVTALAQQMRIPPIVIGITVVAIGTSTPDLAVGIDAAVIGNGPLAVGNIAGTNTVNVLLILGLSALIHPLALRAQTIRKDPPVMILAALMMPAMSLDGLLAELNSAMQELQGLSPRLRVEAGDAFDNIIQVYEAERADLVVMGEHRKRLLQDVFVGTTIERVMRLGQRPVLMVNAPPERPYRRVRVTVGMSEPSAHALRTAYRLGLLSRAELTVFHAF